MNPAFLIAALALPPMPNSYKLLRGFIKSYKPEYEVVLVNKDETLIGGERTPVIFKNLRVWLVKGAA